MTLDCKLSKQMKKADELMNQELLKKYLIYARRFIKPKMSEIDKDKIKNFYADIRRESSVTGGIPIAVRHIESIMRMSEAFARMQLRDYVTVDDIDEAIEMLIDSFLQTQKASIRKVLERKFEKYRKRSNDVNPLLLHMLQKRAQNQVSPIIAMTL